jgi:hypothetical protein
VQLQRYRILAKRDRFPSWRHRASFQLAREFLCDLYVNLADHRDALVALVSADGLGSDLAEELVAGCSTKFC